MSGLWDTVWSNDPAGNTVGDWNLAGLNSINVGGFENIDPLGTAVLIALFTEARLPNYMIGRYGFTQADQKEWHGNTFSIDNQYSEEPLGSLLYVIRRAPLTAATAKLAEHYAAAALQPLIRQRRASFFEIFTEIDKARGCIKMLIRSYGPDREWKSDIFPLQ